MTDYSNIFRQKYNEIRAHKAKVVVIIVVVCFQHTVTKKNLYIFFNIMVFSNVRKKKVAKVFRNVLFESRGNIVFGYWMKSLIFIVFTKEMLEESDRMLVTLLI